MKRTITAEEVKPMADLPAEFIGLEDNDGGRWILCSENKGYIFRQKVGGSIGHSGQWETKRELCHRTMYYSKEIVAFESQAEMMTWLAEVPMKWKE